MNLTFKIYGPIVVPAETHRLAKMIPAGCREIWHNQAKIAKSRGCYVFGIRASKGYRPLYVGKTRKSFESECFTNDKVLKYNQALLDTEKGKPVMFFVIAPQKKGKPNDAIIKDVESFLIEIGATRNPELLNVKGANQKRWGIKGIVRGGKGKVSKPAKEFKRMMGLNP